jgi:hypothetical protein
MMFLENNNYNLQRMPKNTGKIAATRFHQKSFDLAGDNRPKNCPIGRLKRTLCNVFKVHTHQKNK